MGDEADYIATAHSVSRADQDAFALESHRRALAATAAGDFAAEIVPLTVRAGKTEVRVERDEGPRVDTHAEALARLKPAFSGTGTVTAGNSSQISDAAAAVVVASEAVARRSESPLKARIVASAISGVRPKESVHRAGRRHRKGVGQGQAGPVRHRSGRVERGLRRPVPGLHAGPRAQCGQDQCPRRSHRFGPSDRGQRRPGDCHPAACHGRSPGAARTRRALLGGRQRRGDDHRAQ